MAAIEEIEADTIFARPAVVEISYARDVELREPFEYRASAHVLPGRELPGGILDASEDVASAAARMSRRRLAGAQLPCSPL